MAETHELETAQLVAAMEGDSMTSLWDLLVSYKAEQLNKLLAQIWAEDTRTDVINVGDKEVDQIHRTKCDYKLTTKAPTLSFETTGDCRACLSIPINGSITTTYYRKKDNKFTETDQEEIALDLDALCLKVRVPIKSVRGRAEDVTQAHVDNNSESADKVLLLGTKKEDTGHIILHFSSPDTSYKVESLLPGAKVPEAFTAASGLIANWFTTHVKAIDYRLATVSPAQDSSDSDAILKPKTFTFATSGDILCIYIQTVGSGNDEGVADAKFMIRNPKGDGLVPARPIPKGYTSSIIISHRLFQEKVFLPQLQKYQTDQGISIATKAPAAKEVKRGFKFDFYVKSDFQVRIGDKNGFRSWSSYSDKDVHLDDQPTTLVVEDNTAKWSYSQTFDLEWSHTSTSITAGVSGYGGAPSSRVYNANGVIAAKQETPFAVIKDHSNIEIDLSISQTAYSLTKTMKSQGRIDPAVEALQFQFKPVVLKSPNLNFIAAESVLAPGKTMVDVVGVYTPYDVMLLGNLRG